MFGFWRFTPNDLVSSDIFLVVVVIWYHIFNISTMINIVNLFLVIKISGNTTESMSATRKSYRCPFNDSRYVDVTL